MEFVLVVVAISAVLALLIFDFVVRMRNKAALKRESVPKIENSFTLVEPVEDEAEKRRRREAANAALRNTFNEAYEASWDAAKVIFSELTDDEKIRLRNSGGGENAFSILKTIPAAEPHSRLTHILLLEKLSPTPKSHGSSSRRHDSDDSARSSKSDRSSEVSYGGGYSSFSDSGGSWE